MRDNIHCELISERNLLIHFGEHISESLLDTIQQAELCAAKVFGHQLKDLIASYTTLLIEFDPLLISPWQAQIKYQKAWDKHCRLLHSQAFKPNKAAREQEMSCIEIPVYYHPSVAWDILPIAKQKGLTWQQIAELHSQRQYRVYAMGFAPGFAFMGQIDPCLEMPRKTSPRTNVPAGSVAISDLQTAIYPNASPGGWHIIGRSPCELFNPDNSPAALLKTADSVRFKSVDKERFIQLGGCLDDLRVFDDE